MIFNKKFFIYFLLIQLTLFFRPADALLNISVFPATAHQGKTFVVTIDGDDSYKSVCADFLGKNIPFYKYENGFRGVIGVNVFAPTGPQALKIFVTDENGNAEEFNKEIIIRPTKFIAEKLLFMPGKKEKLVSEKIKTDQDEMAEILKQESEDQLWNGRFIMPIKGRITSSFGSYRLYNGKRLGDHRGLDIGGNPVGAKIRAANSGIVAFAKLLPALGSVIIIDHGQGILSIYMHMSKTLVSVGEKVSKGRVIGKVGSTGLSTGPHLHWGLSVHDTRVSPLEWVNRLVTE